MSRHTDRPLTFTGLCLGLCWFPVSVALAANEPVHGAHLKTVTQGTRVTGEGRYFTTVRVPMLDQDQVVRQCLPDGPCFSALYYRERTGFFARRHHWVVNLWNPGAHKLSAKWSCHRHQEGYIGVTHRLAEDGLTDYAPNATEPAAARSGFVCVYDNPAFKPEWIEFGLEWVAQQPPVKRRAPAPRPSSAGSKR